MNYRNVKNCYAEEYNCGGYALGTFDWYLPYDDFSVADRVLFGNENPDDVLRDMANFILDEFNGYIREISDFHELHENENAVAFRISEDDFHFILRQNNGHWYHKRGSHPIESIKKKDVFDDEWYNGGISYDTDIILFAVQRERIINEQENF